MKYKRVIEMLQHRIANNEKALSMLDAKEKAGMDIDLVARAEHRCERAAYQDVLQFVQHLEASDE